MNLKNVSEYAKFNDVVRIILDYCDECGVEMIRLDVALCHFMVQQKDGTPSLCSFSEVPKLQCPQFGNIDGMNGSCVYCGEEEDQGLFNACSGESRKRSKERMKLFDVEMSNDKEYIFKPEDIVKLHELDIEECNS